MLSLNALVEVERIMDLSGLKAIILFEYLNN